MTVKLLYILSWVVFFFLHSALASSRVKNYLQPLISFRYYRFFYNAVSTLSLIPVVLFYYLADARYLFKPEIVVQVPGVLIILLSLGLWRKTFKNYSLAEFAGTDRLQKGYVLKPKLRKSRLNRLVRHPLYSVSYLLIIGLFLLFPHDLMLITAVLVFIYFPIGIYFEERKLIKVFGDEYVSYKRKTPALFPNPGSIIKFRN